MKDFALNLMKETTNSGFIINHFTQNQQVPDKSEELGTHRDDFYMFFLIEGGQASMMIDFKEVILPEYSIFYVLPGQVHQRFSTTETAIGWFLGVDTPIIPPDFRDVFNNRLLLQNPLILPAELVQQCSNIMSLVDERNHNYSDSTFNLPVLHSLVQSYLGIVAGNFKNLHGVNDSISRPAQLSYEFKKLLGQHMVTIKSPSQYAALLNVSESYLNEVLKKTTGFTVSYWIQNQTILEAKRLLYYSQLNVKEIAHQLGYEDSTYFLRTFKKFTGITPLSFRSEYRK